MAVVPNQEYIFFYGKRNENHEFGTDFLVYKRITSAVKTVEFVSSHWFHITVMNVYAPAEDKTDDMKEFL
jgi:hypothetical protein